MNLRDHIRIFVERALEQVAAYLQANEIPSHLIQRVDFSRSHQLSAGFSEVLSWHTVLRDVTPRLQVLPASREAIAALLADGRLQLPLVTDRDGKPASPDQQLREGAVLEKLSGLVQAYLATVGRPRMDDEAFGALYEDFERTWLSTTVWHTVTVPLLSFHSEVLPIELSPTLRIDALEPETKSDLWSYSILSYQHISAHQMAEAAAALRVRYTTKSAIHFENSVSGEAIANVIFALRLLKRGDVFPAAAYDRVESLQPGVTGSADLESAWRPLPTQPLAYHLLAEDIPSFMELFSAITGLPQEVRAQLHVARSRFMQAYSRQTAEDRVIDLAIGFESTLLFGENQELSHRLALRGAYLLRKYCQPKETFDILRALYQVRSKVVHQGMRVLQSTKRGLIAGCTPDVFLARCDDLYRRWLRLLVSEGNMGRALSALIADVDEQIVEALSAPAE